MFHFLFKNIGSPTWFSPTAGNASSRCYNCNLFDNGAIAGRIVISEIEFVQKVLTSSFSFLLRSV